jgi:hypothetical protein
VFIRASRLRMGERSSQRGLNLPAVATHARPEGAELLPLPRA